ncbi:ABC transporter permease [Gordonia sp. PDNC005]|uniref:ABC transporter permease n=1 Tax=unclassified Gordonia (in: high G+C Gram-positive bacteria) TaxID=2657482 RepID=UPI0019662B36|nr:ABC transporter permease [Gordonia sp. PDNC005]QRY64183.1 ABC transporter permease [Gordonia sp. PDNC005]
MTTDTRAARSTTIQLWAQPLVVAVLAGGVLAWALSRDLTDTQKATINSSYIAQLIGEHLALTVAITAIVLAVSVPLAVLVTRNRFRWLAPLFVGIANIGQAAPAIGLLVLFFLWTATTGFWIGVLPVAFYSLLPVLRNSILGLNEVDRALIDAARGQGMSEVRILLTVELPLAVPFILAGLRTSLVLAVGTATLCFLVDAGGLGILIDTGYKLRDNVTLVTGAVLAVSLALIVDWCGALAERYLGPKGLR